jgi:translation initiation factor 2D
VTTILRSALIHALLNTLSKLPAGTLPMASSQLYTAYILPARPAHKVETSSPVDIKHSSHKTLATFLKACEKEGLVILKQGKGDILLASVPKTHPAFEDHTLVSRLSYLIFSQLLRSIVIC